MMTPQGVAHCCSRISSVSTNYIEEASYPSIVASTMILPTIREAEDAKDEKR